MKVLITDAGAMANCHVEDNGLGYRHDIAHPDVQELLRER